MSRMRWDRTNKPRETERAFPKKKEKARGGWTHVKRQPCRSLTPSEIEAWKAERGME